MLRERAIILKTTVVRESDVLLYALGEQSGKISLLARGARRSRKRFLGGLEIFDSGIIEYAEKKAQSQSATLAQFNRGIHWSKLTASLDALVCAALCCETTDMFCPVDDESCGELFKPLFNSLRAIDAAESKEECLSVAVFYCLKLLHHAGLDAVEALEDTCSWFIEMQGSNTVILPRELKQFSHIPDLLQYIEEQAQQALRCKEQLLSIVQKSAK